MALAERSLLTENSVRCTEVVDLATEHRGVEDRARKDLFPEEDKLSPYNLNLGDILGIAPALGYVSYVMGRNCFAGATKTIQAWTRNYSLPNLPPLPQSR